jgi:hypothetical protein
MNLRAVIFLLLAGASPSLGDTVYMLDGTTREGLVETYNSTELHLRVDRDGITGTLTIPMAQIQRALITHRAPDPAPAPTPTIPSTLDAAPPTAPVPLGADPFADATNRDYTIYRDHGRLIEFANTFVGHGLDDLGRLPLPARTLWIRAVQADASKRGDAIDALRALEASMRHLPDGISRLDAISRRERKEGFGVWMARVHWESLGKKPINGQFDLADVRDVEWRPLIGFLKENTGPCLESLRAFFPPVDERTGQYSPFRPAQLQNIGASNALDVKEKANYAAAVLLAQLRLEPGMPPVDKGNLYNQLAIVNRIRAKATEMESSARAAMLKAEMERRAADEKARREASRPRSK